MKLLSSSDHRTCLQIKINKQDIHFGYEAYEGLISRCIDMIEGQCGTMRPNYPTQKLDSIWHGLHWICTRGRASKLPQSAINCQQKPCSRVYLNHPRRERVCRCISVAFQCLSKSRLLIANPNQCIHLIQ